MITYKDDGVGYDENGYEADDGTMPHNLRELENAVVGHRIVRVDRNPPRLDNISWWHEDPCLALTLDDGTEVVLAGTNDCCAHTSLEGVVERLDTMDHVITKVTHDGDFDKWFIIADMETVLELDVSWGCGNPFYYSYGFEITVRKADGTTKTTVG